MAKIVGIVLIVLGLAGLAYKSFTVPGEKKGIQIGSVDLSVQKKERIEVPTWAGVAAVAVGAALLVAGGRK
ncbi:MAG: hypothetical protein NDJ75_05635 [Thermoanaerobaculia bacterium]|nr:hypothetical protein [Thermoanaerobaculia bacterium]